MIKGISERDTTLVAKAIGYVVEKWRYEAYCGLRDNQVSLIDCKRGNCYDLAEIGKLRHRYMKMLLRELGQRNIK